MSMPFVNVEGEREIDGEVQSMELWLPITSCD